MGTQYTFHAATLVQNCVVVVQVVYALTFVRCLSNRFYNGRVRLLYRRKIVGPNTVVEPHTHAWRQLTPTEQKFCYKTHFCSVALKLFHFVMRSSKLSKYNDWHHVHGYNLFKKLKNLWKRTQTSCNKFSRKENKKATRAIITRKRTTRSLPESCYVIIICCLKYCFFVKK